ncbi:hypothetical protein, partial [uncultured Alistipes sp.]|uniref:hypothetical protein n=1 Tax=uncultured Alistipes sp. TaxID=538949 RepID=UPI00261C0D24
NKRAQKQTRLHFAEREYLGRSQRYEKGATSAPRSTKKGTPIALKVGYVDKISKTSVRGMPHRI